MKTQVVTLELEKPTKNTFRYQADNSQPAAVPTLFIQKWATGDPPPQRITLTIEPEAV